MPREFISGPKRARSLDTGESVYGIAKKVESKETNWGSKELMVLSGFEGGEEEIWIPKSMIGKVSSGDTLILFRENSWKYRLLIFDAEEEIDRLKEEGPQVFLSS